MNTDEVFVRMIRDHLGNLTEKERVAYLVKLLWKSKYAWGDEVVGGTDCSGSLSWALWLMGYKIRTTAAGFYERFSSDLPKGGWAGPGDLLFVWEPHGPAIIHVAVFTDRGILLNAGKELSAIPLGDLLPYFPNSRSVVRQLDMEKVRLQSDGSQAFGVNKNLIPLLGMFSQEAIDVH